jgi:hypothetical protein
VRAAGTGTAEIRGISSNVGHEGTDLERLRKTYATLLETATEHVGRLQIIVTDNDSPPIERRTACGGPGADFRVPSYQSGGGVSYIGTGRGGRAGTLRSSGRRIGPSPLPGP